MSKSGSISISGSSDTSQSLAAVHSSRDTDNACNDLLTSPTNHDETSNMSNLAVEKSDNLPASAVRMSSLTSGSLLKIPQKRFRLDSNGSDGLASSSFTTPSMSPLSKERWSSPRRSTASNASQRSRLNADASFQALSAQPLAPVLITPLVSSTINLNAAISNTVTDAEGRRASADDDEFDPTAADSIPVPNLPTAEFILRTINSSNIAQTVVFLLCFISFTMLSINVFAQSYFLAGNMDYTCINPPPASRFSNIKQPNETKSRAAEKADQCYVTTDAGIQPCTAWNYSSPYYTRTMLAEFDLVCTRAYGVSLFQSVQFWGTTLGVFACGPLADHFGRRTVFLFATPAFFLCEILMALTPSYGFQLLLLRFLSGMLCDADYQVKFTIVMEMASDRKRYKFMPLMRLGWPLCTLYAAALAWWLQNESWRTLQWACVFASAVALPMALLVPESVIWLCAKAQDDAARGAEKSSKRKLKSAVKTMKRMARINHIAIEEQQWNALLSSTTRDADVDGVTLDQKNRNNWFPLRGVEPYGTYRSVFIEESSTFSSDHTQPDASSASASNLRRRRSSATKSPSGALLLSPTPTQDATAATPATTTTTIPSTSALPPIVTAQPASTSLVSAFLSQPLLRSTILLIIVQTTLSGAWQGNAFYAMGFFPGSPYVTLTCLSVAQILANYSLLYVVEWCGSTRRTIIILLGACIVIYGLLTGLVCIDGWLEQSAQMPRELINYLYVFLAVLICCCCGAGASTTYIYVGETYPVRVRQTGFGICKGVANIFVAFVPFAANMLGLVWRPLPALLFWAACCVGFVAAVMLPTIALPDAPASANKAAKAEVKKNKQSREK